MADFLIIEVVRFLYRPQVDMTVKTHDVICAGGLRIESAVVSRFLQE